MRPHVCSVRGHAVRMHGLEMYSWVFLQVVEELKKEAAGKEYWADFSWSSVYMGAATIMLMETNQARCV